jgi:hypothetical protein
MIAIDVLYPIIMPKKAIDALALYISNEKLRDDLIDSFLASLSCEVNLQI